MQKNSRSKEPYVMLFCDHLPAFLPQLTGCWVPKPNCKAESLRSDHSYHRHKVCANSPARRQVLGNQPMNEIIWHSHSSLCQAYMRVASMPEKCHAWTHSQFLANLKMSGKQGQKKNRNFYLEIHRFKQKTTNIHPPKWSKCQNAHQEGDHIVPVEESHLCCQSLRRKLFSDRYCRASPIGVVHIYISKYAYISYVYSIQKYVYTVCSKSMHDIITVQ